MNDIEVSRSEFPLTSDSVRYIKLGDDILFSAPDVCRPLGYKNTQSALAKLNESQKLALTSADVSSVDQINTWMPNSGRMNLVTEAGLDVLTRRSDNPNAGPFRDWVTAQLLPAIRLSVHRSGETPETPGQTIHDKGEIVVVSQSTKKAEVRRLSNGAVHCDHGQMEEIVSKTRRDENDQPFTYYRCPQITGADRRGVRTVCGTWSPVRPAKVNSSSDVAATNPANPNATSTLFLETAAGRIYGTPGELAKLLKAMN